MQASVGLSEPISPQEAWTELTCAIPETLFHCSFPLQQSPSSATSSFTALESWSQM